MQDRIRRFNREVTNPRLLQWAGQPGSSTSIVHHTGGTTAAAYRAPVMAVPTDGRFVVALPYGPEVDWARNLRAAGAAMLAHEGRRVPLHEPTLTDRGTPVPLSLLVGAGASGWLRRSRRSIRRPVSPAGP